jgi:hypothetical protein
MKGDSTPRWDAECTLVGQVAAGISLLTLLVFLQRGDLLLYGDAVAHINIARRVFDSRSPGLLQLGTVWLPLPHLLILPFVLSDSAWRSGIAGAIPSMVAYVLGTIGIFRLARGTLSTSARPSSAARIAAWIAAAMFAANPNLMYMQTSAMTEPLYLAWSIWAVAHFSEFTQQVRAENGKAAGKLLLKCGVCLAGACLTRYDGWLLAAAICVVSAIMVAPSAQKQALQRAFAKFVLIAAAAPVLWLVYNAAIFGDPLEFSRGPYSAKAIEERIALSRTAAYPGWHDPRVAFSYFFKAAEQTVSEGHWQKLWVAVLLAGVVTLLVTRRQRWPVLLLLVPIPFYVLSISYGSVPVCFPEWWPFSYYNVRFGLGLLPAFVVLTCMALHWALSAGKNASARNATGTALLLLVAGSYASVWRAQPICFREAWVNSRSRIALETELARTLQLLPHDSTVLMYLGDHVGALQDAGIPLRRTINEGNRRPWKRPDDPEGLWERALANPRQYADYAVAIGDDLVARRANKQELTSMVVIRTLGQPPATIYWTHRADR